MLWFFYVMLSVQTWIDKQDVSIRAAPAPAGSIAVWRGSATGSTTAWRGSAVGLVVASWRGSTSWVTVRNYLSSSKGKDANDVVRWMMKVYFWTRKSISDCTGFVV
jgi:hypothetical protein